MAGVKWAKQYVYCTGCGASFSRLWFYTQCRCDGNLEMRQTDCCLLEGAAQLIVTPYRPHLSHLLARDALSPDIRRGQRRQHANGTVSPRFYAPQLKG